MNWEVLDERVAHHRWSPVAWSPPPAILRGRAAGQDARCTPRSSSGSSFRGRNKMLSHLHITMSGEVGIVSGRFDFLR